MAKSLDLSTFKTDRERLAAVAQLVGMAQGQVFSAFWNTDDGSQHFAGFLRQASDQLHEAAEHCDAIRLIASERKGRGS